MGGMSKNKEAVELAMQDYKKIVEIEDFNSQLQKLKPFRWYGQTVLFKTWKWGKEYVWLRDGTGVHYMVRADEDGLPIIK